MAGGKNSFQGSSAASSGGTGDIQVGGNTYAGFSPLTLGIVAAALLIGAVLWFRSKKKD